MRNWSHQYYFLPTRNIDFSLLWSFKPCKQFLFFFHVAMTSDPPPSCKVPAECFRSSGQKVKSDNGMTWKLRAGDSRRATAPTGSTSTPAPPPENPKSPGRHLHHKEDTKDQATPPTFLPSLVELSQGWVKGNGRVIKFFFPLSTHHRPLGVPWFKA